MKHLKYFLLFSLLLIIAYFEMIGLSEGVYRYGLKNNTWLYLFSGLLFGIFYMLPVEKPTGLGHKWSKYLLFFPFAYLFYQYYQLAVDLMLKIPVDYKLADMLPIMEIMCKRFMNQTGVYRIIPEIWGGMEPIYLPTMWMSYLPAVWFDFDLRWITWFSFILAILLGFLSVRKYHVAGWHSLLVWITVFVLFKTIFKLEPNDFSMGDEGPVVLFFVLFAFSLWKGNAVWIGITMALGLLTRYSFLPVLPAIFLAYWHFDHKKALYTILGSAFLTGVFLMTITGAIFEIHTFLALPKHYVTAVIGEDFQKLSPTIQNGLGLAKFFPKENIPSIVNIQMLLTFLVPILLLILYKYFSWKIDFKVFLLGLLKLEIVLFYNLMIIPIHNLFLVSNFLTIALLFFYAQVTEEKLPENHPS
jgi:hypothetical protein